MRTFGNFSRQWAVNERGMSILLFHGFFLLGLFVAMMPDVLVLGSPVPSSQHYGERPVQKKHCYYLLTGNLLHVKCVNMEFQEIPNTLRPNIQALELSTNRVRELTNNSLAPYKNLAYVYLNDNFITTIEEGAFANQHYLEVLDLSKNGCDSLPTSLFQIPSLRTLYLVDNKLTDSVLNVQITSPLQELYLSKNKLTKIPDIGLQPALLRLNVSDNAIASISPEDVAPFCSLQLLSLARTSIKFNNANCECQTFNAWVKLRNIKLIPGYFNCTKPPIAVKNCTNIEFTNRTYELYDECSAIIQQKMETEKARSVWITVIISVSGFLFLVFVVLFCVHKRNRRRRRRQMKEEQQLAANNANTELLNSNLKQVTH
ncbi:leucine-rich repeat-containing protein let-4 [Pseudomyrmex gracilis]|uniref:leucine-rich repeat-containing protein let-4 n=1 Tax=Pseudomyrmex gracilis TaxID=219809 RepID=UPI000994DC0B|nr:leucine-rich repeat-containing protein let-4 [Pseudomyrmex gracilis]XP_020289516.1 leucine-rich repeat-containing protein let-4 [Pseudomyrmex gracilis]XP_020289517.1 leucine-rich repeat-containing protein let-4 [Pseudomyrmex gracilis]XP_020289518.1 leucine-rich repeat-containing protein let-4 [Pseudomyrmex gracilis]